MSGLFDFLYTTANFLAKSLRVLLVAFAAIMIGVLTLGVIYRYVLQDALAWADEISMVIFTILTFLGAALLTFEDGHVRITMFLDKLPPRIRYLVDQVQWFIFALTGAFMAWTGYGFLRLTAGQVLPATRLPSWVSSVVFFICGVLICLFALANGIRACRAGAAAKRFGGQ